MRNINVNQNFENIEVKEFRTILPYKSMQNRLSLENNQVFQNCFKKKKLD